MTELSLIWRCADGETSECISRAGQVVVSLEADRPPSDEIIFCFTGVFSVLVGLGAIIASLELLLATDALTWGRATCLLPDKEGAEGAGVGSLD